MTLWFVLDMDDGILGVYTTKKQAKAEFPDGPVVDTYRFGAGSYEVFWRFDVDDPYEEWSFFLNDEFKAKRDWLWAYEPWVGAGKPMGRLDEPIPGRDSRAD